MNVPYICNKCDKVKEHDVSDFNVPCLCGGVMEVNYSDNYEKVYDLSKCHTCIYNTVVDGKECSYCNNI